MIVSMDRGMKRRPARKRIQDALARIRRIFRREPEAPDDPHAYVGAPKKPRPPHRSAAAAEPLD